MTLHSIDRRKFLKTAATAAAGFSLLPAFAKNPPSDMVRIAHIGLGGMGNNHMDWFSALPNVQIVALCDLDSDHLGKTLQKLKTNKPGSDPKTYSDFRRVLERKDIDAITCATPDHWHAQVAALAFEAGKDVYGEKPLSYSIGEGRMMLNKMKRHNRIFQLGTQIHAQDNYHRVVEIIQSGAIGKVHTVRLWKTGFSPGLGHPSPVAPPASLNWDMWLGPAPATDYFPERCHFNYRYFLDYSGGVFADFWCHIADIVWWAAKPSGLSSIVARGEKTDGVATAPKWLDADFEFENLKLYWTTQPPNVPGASTRGIGAWFEGDKGTLLCDYSTREITINGQTMNDIQGLSQTIPRSPGHQQNFIDSLKSRTQPESNLPYAREMTLPMHLAVLSWRLGRRINWNSETETCVNDNEANSLLTREPRKAWNLVTA